jgi:RNA-directed DNA polymerase
MEKRLIDLISEPATLENAWRSVRRGSPSSSGIDNITIAEFARNWFQEKKSIQASLRTQTYNFSPYRGQPIQKRKGASIYDLKAWRPISIPTVRDRIVQRAILDRIWKDIRSHVYIETSFGGIRQYKIRSRRTSQTSPLDSNDRRCVKSAVKRILDLRAQGYGWVFETDIENFFPSIDRTKLFDFLHNLLRDFSIDALIQSALDTSVANAQELGKLAELWDPTSGVPQGGILSPILANLYLYNHDKSLSDLGFRLVDDLVILQRTKKMHI